LTIWVSLQFYWSGLISLSSPENLLTHFFSKASDVLRGEVLAFIGRAFYQTGETTPTEIIEHCQRLWEWRVSAAQVAGQMVSYEHEIAAFGWWFRADICPPEWGLYQLETALTLVGYVELSYAVVERLAKLAESYPDQIVRCLGFLIKGDTIMWTTSIREKVVRHILISALQNGTGETQREAKAIISWLAFHDMTDFLDLLPRKE
jgi:hypothetical protein